MQTWFENVFSVNQLHCFESLGHFRKSIILGGVLWACPPRCRRLITTRHDQLSDGMKFFYRFMSKHGYFHFFLHVLVLVFLMLFLLFPRPTTNKLQNLKPKVWKSIIREKKREQSLGRIFSDLIS